MMETNAQQPVNNILQSKLKTQLHVRENSRDELEALFDPAKFSSIKPLNKRNLPDSFFKPPEKGTKTPNSHSRQSSVDSTLLTNSTSINHHQHNLANNINQQIQKKILNNQNNHLRSNSEPAVITSFSLAQQQGDQFNNNNNGFFNHHQRQNSVSSEAPLPQGWEMIKAPNGQRYFIK
jgi:hypothetical protein